MYTTTITTLQQSVGQNTFIKQTNKKKKQHCLTGSFYTRQSLLGFELNALIMSSYSKLSIISFSNDKSVKLLKCPVSMGDLGVSGSCLLPRKVSRHCRRSKEALWWPSTDCSHWGKCPKGSCPVFPSVWASCPNQFSFWCAEWTQYVRHQLFQSHTSHREQSGRSRCKRGRCSHDSACVLFKIGSLTLISVCPEHSSTELLNRCCFW